MIVAMEGVLEVAEIMKMASVEDIQKVEIVLDKMVMVEVADTIKMVLEAAEIAKVFLIEDIRVIEMVLDRMVTVEVE